MFNRFYGKVGYGVTEEQPEGSGIYLDTVKEVFYKGDVIRNSIRWNQSMNSTNDNIVLSNTISIIADAYAFNNYQNIRYVEVDGAKWRVSSVEIQRPRILLYLGGVYNGPTPPEE